MCLAATIRSFVDGPTVSTAGYVKLLLPPRQSRGNSHWGLGCLGHPLWGWQATDCKNPCRVCLSHQFANSSCVGHDEDARLCGRQFFRSDRAQDHAGPLDRPGCASPAVLHNEFRGNDHDPRDEREGARSQQNVDDDGHGTLPIFKTPSRAAAVGHSGNLAEKWRFRAARRPAICLKANGARSAVGAGPWLPSQPPLRAMRYAVAKCPSGDFLIYQNHL